MHYFIFTSTTVEFRKNHLNSCLKFYYEEVAKVVEEMGGSLPKGFCQEELITTFNENRYYGSGYNLVTIPFQLGITAPPPSPMTPVELDSMAYKSGKEGNKENIFFAHEEEKHERRTNFNQQFHKWRVELVEGTRNSPVALKWLRELVDEMVEYDVI